MNRKHPLSSAWAWSATLFLALGMGGVLHGAPAKNGPDRRPVPATIEFERDVKPILAESCLACHGPDQAKGGVKLTDRDAALSKSKKGRLAIVPGKPEESELIRRVAATDPDKRMPPADDPHHEPLNERQVEVLRRWIAQGAVWQDHWAYRPLKMPKAPAVKNESWVRNPIDAFVLAQLEARGIAPSPEADRYTLIKRLSYDLTGLPPTPEEADAFVSDKSSDAYDKLVTRLLSSPHFGERWGRHWLDKARYADSDGYEKDRARPDAYIYRDWVINAFNSDMPFDQFTVEQIAGDLLPGSRASQKIATAFNRQTLTNEEGGVDQEEYRVAAVFDRVDTVGTIWLGLTVGCAKCHTHKYDQIMHAEYYQLFAFFNDSDEVTLKLPVKATDLAAYEEKLYPLEKALQARRVEIAPLQKQWEEEQRAKLEGKPDAEVKAEPVEVDAAESKSGASLVVKGSEVNVSGVDPATDTYRITFKAGGEFSGVRLEALAHESLPGKGPGRSRGGNFVVNHLRLFVVDAAGKARAVSLQQPDATFTQKNFNVDDVITGGDAKKGWAIAGKNGTDQSLTVRTAKPLNLAAGETLRLEIQQDYGGNHTLGRFRLAAVNGEVPLPKPVVAALNMYPEKRVAATKKLLFDYYAGQDAQVRELEAKIAALQKEYKTQLMDVRTLGASLRKRTTHRFDRGDFLSPAEEVKPQTLAVLPAMKQASKRPTRLDLARWLIADDNPLTPRVAVNQVWFQLFGAGLVPTVNDFGIRGERPTHPELLDYLAATYQRDLEWSTKQLIRLIVSSATYRQSSAHRTELVEVDPLNTLLYRQNRLRVEGEIVRDLALSVGGLLSPKVGGPSVFPAMPEDLAKLSYANNFSWKTSTGEDRYRRGMYTFFKRTIPHPTLMTFDCPDANTATVTRTISNTPLQALTLLNNESFHEASVALAKRVLSGPPADDADRLARAMRLALARPVSQSEAAKMQSLLVASRDYYQKQPEAAAQLIGKNIDLPGVAAGEAAAWVATVRVILNLDEFITRE